MPRRELLFRRRRTCCIVSAGLPLRRWWGRRAGLVHRRAGYGLFGWLRLGKHAVRCRLTLQWSGGGSHSMSRGLLVPHWRGRRASLQGTAGVGVRRK